LQRIARVMAAPFKDGNIFAQGLDHGRWSFYLGRSGSGRRRGCWREVRLGRGMILGRLRQGPQRG
jgi:hypothetical protein